MSRRSSPSHRRRQARYESASRPLGGGGGLRFGGDSSGRSGTSPLTLLLVTVSLGVTLGILHNRWTRSGKPDPALAGVRVALLPFQIGATRTQTAALTGWRWSWGAKSISDENARLLTENARLIQENEALRAEAADADRLRALLGFTKSAKNEPLLAEVVGLLPSAQFDTITVSRGTRDGVAVGTIARTPSGLVGQVTEASAITSQVTLLTDLNSGVSVHVVRGGKIKGTGIAQGAGRNLPLELVYLKREDDVQAGDKVVSSGFGEVIPPGVPVGVVVSVRQEKEGFLKVAHVITAAPQPGMLRDVLLVRGLKP